MTSRDFSARRIAEWAALSQVILAAAYLITGVGWLWSAAPGVDRFRPTDPYLAMLEVLIILSGIAAVFLAAAGQSMAHESLRAYGSAGLSFAVMFAALTISTHFAQLTVLSRSPAPIVIWPSVPNTLDLLAWDLFFGISLVCLAVAVRGQTAWPHSLFLSAGILCMAGFAGPASGHLTLHLLATVGYAGIYPAACFVLWLRLRR